MVPAMGHEVDCELAPAPLNHYLGAPGKHWFRKSPTDERAFVEVQDFVRKVPAHCRSKILTLDTLENVIGKLPLPMFPFPPQWYSSVPKKPFLVLVSPWGKMKAREWVPSFSSGLKCSQRGLFLSYPSRVLSHELHDWEAVSRWENSSQGLEVTKGIPVLLTTSNSISRPAHKLPECLTCASSWLAHRYPQHSACHTYASPTTLALCALQWQWERALPDG